MPLTPSERETVEMVDLTTKTGEGPERIVFREMVRIARRLNRESIRQRRTIEHLKRRLRAWEGN